MIEEINQNIEIEILKHCLKHDEFHTSLLVEALSLSSKEIRSIVEKLISDNKIELLQKDEDGYLLMQNKHTSHYLASLNKNSSDTIVTASTDSSNGKTENIININESFNITKTESSTSLIKWLIPVLISIGILIMAILSYANKNGTDPISEESLPQEESDSQSQPIFKSDDTRFKVLILSFYTADDLNESKCIGNSIYTYFQNEKLLNDTSAILYSYNPELGSPNNYKAADAIRRNNNADFLIFGIYSKDNNTCSKLNTCFKYISDSEFEENNLYSKYSHEVFQEVSDVDIIQGEFDSGITSVPKFMISLSYIKEGRKHEAKSLLEDLILNEKIEDVELVKNLARTYIQTHEVEKAIILIDRFLPGTDNKKVLSIKADAYKNLGKYDEAIMLYSLIIGENRTFKNASAVLQRAFTYQMKGEYQNAQEDFEYASRYERWGVFFSGVCYREENNIEKALEKFEIAYHNLKHENDIALNTLLQTAIIAKKYNKVINYCIDAFSNGKSKAIIYEKITLSLICVGNISEARYFINEGLSLYPNNAELCLFDEVIN